MLLVLAVYLALIVLASLGGGWLTARMRLTHTRMQLIMSFVAGLMLGVCFLHMVPHSIHATHKPDLSMIWLVAGLLTTFFLIRAFQFHQHVSAEGDEGHVHLHEISHEQAATSHEHGATSHDHHGHHGHVCEHGHPADLAHARPHELSWLGVFIGLALHARWTASRLRPPFRPRAEVTRAVAGTWSGWARFWACCCTSRWMPCRSRA